MEKCLEGSVDKIYLLSFLFLNKFSWSSNHRTLEVASLKSTNFTIRWKQVKSKPSNKMNSKLTVATCGTKSRVSATACCCWQSHRWRSPLTRLLTLSLVRWFAEWLALGCVGMDNATGTLARDLAESRGSRCPSGWCRWAAARGSLTTVVWNFFKFF